MDYRILAIFAMIIYGLFQFGAKELTTNLPGVSVLVIANISIFVAPVIYIWYAKIPITTSLFSAGPWVLGLLAGIGFIFLFTAIEKGPLSVVAPIYGLYMIIPALLGILLLNEKVTFTKSLGIIFAISAVILLTR